MFYLSHFFKVIWQSKATGIPQLILVFTLFLGVNHIDTLNNILVAPKVSTHSYFNVLAPRSIDIDALKRKLMNLPGVEGVQALAHEKISSKISKLAKNFLPESLDMETNFNFFRVSLNKKISSSSVKLIQEYMTRVTGSTELTFTDLKKPTIQKTDSSIYLSFIAHACIGVCLLVWFIFMNNFSQSMTDYSYIVERYQRRKLIAFKSTLIGYSALGLVAVAITLGIGGDLVLTWSIAIILLVSSIALTIKNRKSYAF